MLCIGNSPYTPCSIAPVKNGEGMIWGACKTPYAFRGTEGVIVYHIKDQNKCLAFMWKVPYARSNGWYIKVYDGFINPSIGNNSNFCFIKLNIIISFTTFISFY